MPEYSRYYTATVSRRIVVEADSLEEARQKMEEEEQEFLGLCYHCANEMELGEEWEPEGEITEEES